MTNLDQYLKRLVKQNSELDVVAKEKNVKLTAAIDAENQANLTLTAAVDAENQANLTLTEAVNAENNARAALAYASTESINATDVLLYAIEADDRASIELNNAAKTQNDISETIKQMEVEKTKLTNEYKSAESSNPELASDIRKNIQQTIAKILVQQRHRANQLKEIELKQTLKTETIAAVNHAYTATDEATAAEKQAKTVKAKATVAKEQAETVKAEATVAKEQAETVKADASATIKKFATEQEFLNRQVALVQTFHDELERLGEGKLSSNDTQALEQAITALEKQTAIVCGNEPATAEELAQITTDLYESAKKLVGHQRPILRNIGLIVMTLSTVFFIGVFVLLLTNLVVLFPPFIGILLVGVAGGVAVVVASIAHERRSLAYIANEASKVNLSFFKPESTLPTNAEVPSDSNTVEAPTSGI